MYSLKIRFKEKSNFIQSMGRQCGPMLRLGKGESTCQHDEQKHYLGTLRTPCGGTQSPFGGGVLLVLGPIPLPPSPLGKGESTSQHDEQKHYWGLCVHHAHLPGPSHSILASFSRGYALRASPRAEFFSPLRGSFQAII